MTKTLDVYLHDHLVGTLIQDNGGQMMFTYLDTWLKDQLALPLSHSLPLRPETFSQKECQGFFGGLLPEEKNRDLIARNLGISKENDFSMLNEIGGECAGAVTFIPHGISLPTENFQSRILSESDLAKILRELPQRPLMAGEAGVRLSLAGAQNKLPVRSDGDIISLPLGNAPSTHIIKPAIPDYEGIVYNEALCMKLAKAIGLSVANVDIGKAEELEYLLIERYDRKKVIVTPTKNSIPSALFFSMTGGEIKLRLHQEDFCQALGISSNNKYQSENGPSIKDCIALIRDIVPVSTSELQKLIDAIIFNFLIGNNDAHGKNFSILYNRIISAASILLSLEKAVYLAPLYDLICTAYYPHLSKTMAMKIGDQYDSNLVTSTDFEKMAEECGLSKPLVKKRVVEIAKKVLVALENRIVEHPIADKVADVIRLRCKDTIESFNA